MLSGKAVNCYSIKDFEMQEIISYCFLRRTSLLAVRAELLFVELRQLHLAVKDFKCLVDIYQRFLKFFSMTLIFRPKLFTTLTIPTKWA